MEYDTAIFDVDATLVQTKGEYIDFIFGEVFKKLNLSGDLVLKKRLWYNPFRSKIVKEEVYSNVGKFWRVLDKTYRESIDERKKNIRVYSESDLKALDSLNDMGVTLGVVSNSPKIMIEMSLELLGKHKFKYSTHVRNKHKSKAAGIEACMKKLKAEKEKTLYVGNDAEDVSAARKAKIDVALIKRIKLDEYQYFATARKADFELSEISDLLHLF